MRVRVLCFAHAGAGVSAFRRWPRLLGPDVEIVPVLLPGRDGRRREPRPTSTAELLDDIAAVVGPVVRSGEPYLLYGHSLGGLISCALVCSLHKKRLALPALLAVGALPPPDAPVALAHCADLPDAELLRVLDTFGSVPGGTEPGDLWHRTALPVLRDDFRLADALRTQAGAGAGPGGDMAYGGPLPVPVLAVAGRDDPLAPPAAMAGWQRWSTGPFTRRTVPGGHFFVRDAALPRLVGRAARVVARTAAPSGGPSATPWAVRTAAVGTGR
ncbi:thioesterase II family protein [Streptomyces sp. NPDC091272]|uniref:thioesterase II family protein n=1 Tax=Streptomyces sp. NPDC091272 TaxID=3365981 RepID=UPI0038274B8C